MGTQLCPKCMRPHDFDTAWDDELWAVWCDTDRRLSVLEAQLRDIGMLREEISNGSDRRATSVDSCFLNKAQAELEEIINAAKSAASGPMGPESPQ